MSPLVAVLFSIFNSFENLRYCSLTWKEEPIQKLYEKIWNMLSFTFCKLWGIAYKSVVVIMRSKLFVRISQVLRRIRRTTLSETWDVSREPWAVSRLQARKIEKHAKHSRVLTFNGRMNQNHRFKMLKIGVMRVYRVCRIIEDCYYHPSFSKTLKRLIKGWSDSAKDKTYCAHLKFHEVSKT